MPFQRVPERRIPLFLKEGSPMQEYLLIGTVLKPQGIHGECKIQSHAADPQSFEGWSTLYLSENGAYLPVSCRFRRVREGFVYAVLADSASMEAAEAFRGKSLYVSRSQIAPSGENEDLIADLIGCEARDENGNLLGVLADVLQHGPVDTWVFRSERGTWMAPALLKVFPAVNAEEKQITVDSARLQEVAVFEN